METIERGVIAFTILTDIIQPLNFAMVWVEIARKPPASEMFSSIFINASYEYCASSKNFPALINLVLPMFKRYAPHFFRECPYLPETDFGIKDFVFDANFMPSITLSTLPRGDYRILVSFNDRKNINMILVKVYLRIAQKRPQKSASKKSG